MSLKEMSLIVSARKTDYAKVNNSFVYFVHIFVCGYDHPSVGGLHHINYVDFDELAVAMSCERHTETWKSMVSLVGIIIGV
ncbi:hypothetical protein CEXT_519481 [Caerostris extrusa]|uniref:Uncharacterized protein n=1 Tax=Caerostris extrusa TaxID=172846 RepID=A0AAV4T775_CAEEX|nr:hypothetical protein CEXT_519481 [Caerostris extrusa]